jgi:NADPH-dependent 2,4-dienoyl-CoA reductase/sulfur reductase-like enzyme
MRRYTIVGSGAAGMSAAETIRSSDPSCQITLISEEQAGYYSRPGLAYYLSGEIPERSLFPFSEEDFQNLKLRRLYSRAIAVHPEAHRLELLNGITIPYDRLLIATGSTAVIPDLPGIDLEGVVKLDNLVDARRIMRMSGRRRRAVVVGGGITALEIVEGLVSNGVRTHYLLRGERYWSNVLDEAEARIVEQRLKHEGVKIHYRTEIEEIIGRRGRVVGVRTKDGRSLPCHILAIAIGVRPRLALAKASGLELGKGVRVDEYLQTSAVDVFAAGDVAEAYDPLAGRPVLDTLWGPARDQGRTSGLNMAGHPTPYRKKPPFNVTRLSGLTTTIIGRVGSGEDPDLAGIARGDSETWRQAPDAITAQDEFEVNRLRLMVGKHSLLGAIIMGDQSLSQPLQELIGHQIDINPIRSQLLRSGAPLGELITSFWDTWKKNGKNRTA